MTRILMLHGWDWEKYPVFVPEHQWLNRRELLAELRKRYEVDYPSLPGFGSDDRYRTGCWTLDDYANWLQEKIAEHGYDAVIGYSFGCAVAIRWQHLHRNSAVPLILLSPAIARAYDRSPNGVLTAAASVLKRLGAKRMNDFLRMLYLTRVVKNPHVIHGSPFLRKTYSSIVSLDLSAELAQLIDGDYVISCVFGGDDTATPPEVLFSRVPSARPLSLVIPAGGHDIGSTHPRELVDHVVNFLNLLEVQQ